MLAVTVLFRIRPDRVEDFRAAVMRQATNSLTNEPQCRQFDVCFRDEEPQDVFLFEVYDDEAAFEAHRQMPYFSEFGKTVAEWIESKDLRIWAIVRPGESKE